MTHPHMTIVFDLIASIQHGFASLGPPAPADAEVRALIGHPLWGTHDAGMLATAAPDELQPDLERLLEHLPPLPRA